MTPVNQTLFGGPNALPEQRGNCLSAAYASLLNLSLDQVPHFVAFAGDDWWTPVAEWLRTQGFLGIEISVRDDVPERNADDVLNLFPFGSFYAIASGPSPRGEFLHSVIVRMSTDGIKYVHDPHPSQAFLKRLTHLKVLIPVCVEA